MTANTTPKAGLALLREPFPPNQISKLPKPVKKDAPKGRCAECGGWHGLPAVHLDYVGHAALTARLLDSDPSWSWEPVGFDDKGLPALDPSGGLWIKLTVCGVTRFGYGDAQGKTGPDAMKDRIGDALRNAAMRFGAALDLWHKGDLYAHEHADEDEHKPAQQPKQAQPDLSPKARAARITEGVAKGDASGAAAAMAEWPQDLTDAVWALLDKKVQAQLTAAWPQAEPA
jgi:hypothetical protein